MNTMRVMILEDDREYCDEYAVCAAQFQDMELSAAYGAGQGIALFQRFMPHVLLLDLELNNSDGDGISFLNNLKKAKIKEQAYIIVITNNIAPKTHAVIRKLGVDYIFVKFKPDYSPKLVLDFAYQYFVLQADITPSGVNVVKEEYTANQIKRAVEGMGMTHDMAGMEYLIEAVCIAITLGRENLKLSRDIYPEIACKNKKSNWCIERAIRNAVIKA